MPINQGISHKIYFFTAIRVASIHPMFFRQILKGYHVEQSFSTPGQPHDNAVLEAFFSGFKKEQVYRNVYRTKEELEASVAEYIEFYNEGRPHRKLNMKTPAQFEAEYFSALNTK